MKWRSHDAAVTTVTVTAPSLFFTGNSNIALTPQTVTPSGGTAPYSFVGVGLPAGVTVGAATGIISGTPTSSGNTTASITVTDSAAHTANIPVFFSIVIGLFTDTLLRTSFTLGTPWIIGYTDPSQAGWFNPTGGIFTSGATGLNLKNPTGGGSKASLPIYAAEDWNAWSGQTQFSEIVINSTSGVYDSGPAVSLCGDSAQGTANGYFVTIENIAGIKFALARANVGEAILSATFAAALNDVIRISVTFSGASNLIHVLQNGADVAGSPFTDNNALRPLSTNAGIPGVFFAGATAASFITFTNYRGGLGLG